MVFDSACRALLFDIAKKYGLQLEEEPEYSGRKYLEKQDYILAKQKEQLALQEEKLEELKKEHPLVTNEKCFTLSWFPETIPSVLSEEEE